MYSDSFEEQSLSLANIFVQDRIFLFKVGEIDISSDEGLCAL